MRFDRIRTPEARTLPICRCCFDLNVMITGSGGRINQKENNAQRAQKKRKQLIGSVKSKVRERLESISCSHLHLCNTVLHKSTWCSTNCMVPQIYQNFSKFMGGM